MKKDKKRCPRCETVVQSDALVCPACRLRFDKLHNLSNSQAKYHLRNHQKDSVIYTTDRPSDINNKKFLQLLFLLGIFGAHNLYIGKYGRGYFSLISTLLYIPALSLSIALKSNGIYVEFISYYLCGILALLVAISFLIWFNDVLSIIMKKFRYPASIPVKIGRDEIKVGTLNG